jgi:multicomponent Na+:H+ antiporter subunit B
MNRILSIIVLLILAFFLFSAVKLDYGRLHPELSQYYITHGVAETGALNMVTAIYLNYRVYDTLGEATVFFAMALGVYMLLRREGEEKTD